VGRKKVGRKYQREREESSEGSAKKVEKGVIRK
jgi:hypothetical protein